MARLDKLTELTTLDKLNTRNRLEDKLRQQEYYGDIEELFDPLTKNLNTNSEERQAHSEVLQAQDETMQALQNKYLAALDSNTNALKSLGHHQQSSFLDERAALLTPTPAPPITLKDIRGEAFAVENVMIDILIQMRKPTSKTI